MLQNKKTLIIGVGNETRRDDGVGAYIIDRLNKLFRKNASITTMLVHQLGPEIIEELEKYDRVIFIDATTEEIPEGFKIGYLSPKFEISFTFHYFSPASLLALLKELTGKSIEGWVCSVKGENFNFGIDLSEKTLMYSRKAMKKLLERILK